MRRMVLIGLGAAACSTSFPAPEDFAHNSGGPSDLPVDLGCAASPEAMADCVEQSRYVEDLTFIADIRPPNSDHWQEVQDLCFQRFTELGYDVELHMYGTGINVVGTRLGTTEPERVVVIAAHYDHLNNCAGADDNATGVAATLEVARILTEAEFARTAVVACWDQEEAGLFGSRSWVIRAHDEDTDVVVNFNFEMIGYADSAPDTQMVPLGFDALFPQQVAWLEDRNFAGDFIAIVPDDLGVEHGEAMLRHAERIGLPATNLPVPAELKTSVALNSSLRRSDHAPFWDFNMPALLITDSSNFRYSAYHCEDGEDTVDKLDHEFSAQVIRAATGAIVEALGLQGKAKF